MINPPVSNISGGPIQWGEDQIDSDLASELLAFRAANCFRLSSLLSMSAMWRAPLSRVMVSAVT